MKEKKKHEPMLIVRDEGLISTQPMKPDDVIVMLLQALLNVWDQEIGEIDVEEAARGVIDFLGDLTIENLRGEDGDDDDEDECGEEDLDDSEIRDGIGINDLEDIIKIILGHKRRADDGKA